MNTGRALAIMFAAGLVLAAPATAAFAESLAGKVGDKRWGQAIPAYTSGPCGKIYKDYVAASGHSAYASTRIGGEVFFCGHSYNASSQKAAESTAMKRCEAAIKQYRLRAISGCEIVASK